MKGRGSPSKNPGTGVKASIVRNNTTTPQKNRIKTRTEFRQSMQGLSTYENIAL